MTEYESSTFGKINLNQPEEYFSSSIYIDNKEVETDLNFLHLAEVDKDSLVVVDNYLSKIDEYEKQIRELIHEDFAKNKQGFTREYIKIHLECLSEEYLEGLSKNSIDTVSMEDQLVRQIRLYRIGFYPEKADKVFAVFDYRINEEESDELLVVVLNKDLSYRITIESWKNGVEQSAAARPEIWSQITYRPKHEIWYSEGKRQQNGPATRASR